MEVITQTEGYLENALKQFSVTDAAIAELEAELMSLKIEGLDDVEGYKKVRAGRLKVKGYRIETEKTRKNLKEESLLFGRGVDGKAKSISSRLLPIETYLKNIEKTIDAKRLEIKQAAENKERERIQGRIKGLYALGMVFDGFGYVFGDMTVSGEQITAMTDEEYDKVIADLAALKAKADAAHAEAERIKKEEEDRIKKERAELIAKSEKLAEERVKAEKIMAYKRLISVCAWNASEELTDVINKLSYDAEQEIDTEIKSAAEEALTDLKRLLSVKLSGEEMAERFKAEQEKIEADKKAIENEKKKDEEDKKRQAEIERVKKEAAAEAVRKKAEKEKKEAEEKAEKERIAKLEAELAEKLRPDKEKLETLAIVLAGLPYPELANEQSYEILSKAQRHISRAIQILRQV